MPSEIDDLNDLEQYLRDIDEAAGNPRRKQKFRDWLQALVGLRAERQQMQDQVAVPEGMVRITVTEAQWAKMQAAAERKVLEEVDHD